jgi:predicted transcriptional regulator
MNNTTTSRSASVLAALRALIPERALSFAEARRLTELQAQRLRELLGVSTPELPEDIIEGLPRIELVEVPDLPSSGATQWSRGRWIIATNAQEPWQRQRFSAGHELWHVINYQTADWLAPADRFTSASAKAERLADYFSGCLYVPKQHLKRLVGEGHDAAELADLFGVSIPAVMVRLNQLGLGVSQTRCATPRHQGRAA